MAVPEPELADVCSGSAGTSEEGVETGASDWPEPEEEAGSVCSGSEEAAGPETEVADSDRVGLGEVSGVCPQPANNAAAAKAAMNTTLHCTEISPCLEKISLFFIISQKTSICNRMIMMSIRVWLL